MPAREDDAAAYLGAGLTEIGRDDTVGGAVARGEPPSGSRRARRGGTRPRTALPDLSVMASGNLGLISFPREPGRVTLERIEQLPPAAAAGAARPPRHRAS